jgi:nicotinamidase/pyrazinamidase
MRILLAIDVQNDFMPGGPLPVPEGDQIVPIINSIRDKFDRVIWTQDWHPANHSSFKENGGIWPVHCVQGTKGAELHKDLIVKPEDIIIKKGQDVMVDSYSAFFDNDHKKSTGLMEILKSMDCVDGIWACGLATNYCVRFSVLDSLNKQDKDIYWQTWLFLDACRGVNIQPNDSIKAVEEMINSGAVVTTAKYWFDETDKIPGIGIACK